MTIGLPISVAVQSSNVVDPTITLDDLMLDGTAPIFSKGLEIKDGDWIFSYQGEDFVPLTYNDTAKEAGVYEIDDILIKDGVLVKVTGKSGTGITTHQRPKEPEEYGAWDSGVDHTTFTERYMRVSASTTNGWLNKTWKSPSGKRWFYMFWEARGYGGCGTGGWRWSAKDLNAYIGERNITWYLRTCLKNNYSTKFDAAKDIKATIPYWGSTECAGGCPKEETVQFQSIIERGGYFYFRTHLNRSIEYVNFESGTAFQYSFMTVISPADIDGFVQKRKTIVHSPFDGKNYTQAIVDTTATNYTAVWTMLASAPFDSLAFGSIVADSIDVKFYDADGTLLSQLVNYKVDNSVANNSDIDHLATVVLYAGETLSSETVIEVTLHGSQVTIGEILAGETLEAGFTNAAFKNNFKDFSPTEEDQWGNYYYIDGVRVREHSGTVEFPLLSYDQMNRLLMMIGGNKVIINSSDSTENEVPDGEKVFEATMMIGRFTNLTLSTKVKGSHIEERGVYTFSIRELV